MAKSSILPSQSSVPGKPPIFKGDEESTSCPMYPKLPAEPPSCMKETVAVRLSATNAMKCHWFKDRLAEDTPNSMSKPLEFAQSTTDRYMLVALPYVE